MLHLRIARWDRIVADRYTGDHEMTVAKTTMTFTYISHHVPISVLLRMQTRQGIKVKARRLDTVYATTTPAPIGNAVFCIARPWGCVNELPSIGDRLWPLGDGFETAHLFPSGPRQIGCTRS